MVKINDPRSDSAAIAMRSLRASNVYKSIKKTIKKCKKFNEDKLNLKKTDIDFYDDFVNCPESIKQELIFLWEEVGDLYEELRTKEEPEEPEEPKEPKEPNYHIQLDLDEELPSPPQYKRLYIMGP